MKIRKEMTISNIAIVIFCIFLVLTVMLTIGFSQDEMMYVDNDVFKNPQRTPAIFNHDEHNEIAEIEDCAECHHLYEDGEQVDDESSEDMRCADCHEEKTDDQAPTLLHAFHQKCKHCHLEKKSGPIMCGECHRR